MHLLPDAARDIVMIYEYFFNLYTRPLLLILDMMFIYINVFKLWSKFLYKIYINVYAF